MSESDGGGRKRPGDTGDITLDPTLSNLRLPSAEPTPFDRQIAAEGEKLSLRDLLNARNELSRLINRRFKQPLALAFCDIVGSTSYFNRFGDEAGQAIMQRLMVLVARALPAGNGRLVETTGDGCFLAWPNVADAVKSLIALRQLIDQDNQEIPGDHRLSARIGVHHGTVLADGDLVTGEAVNLCARVTALAEDGQIVLTRTAYIEIPAAGRTPSKALPPQLLKGIAQPVEVVVLDWRDPQMFPKRVRVLETGEEFELPDRDPLSVGRQAGTDTEAENDVVLSHPDPVVRQKISRRHFSLHRHPEALRVRALSERPTEVDGQALARGEERAVRAGSVVRVAGVLTLVFLATASTGPHKDDPNRTVM